MKSKLFALLALVVLIMPTTFAHADVDKALVQSITSGSSPLYMAVGTRFTDAGVLVDYHNIDFPIAGLTDEQSVINTAEAAIINYATGQGYEAITANNTIWPFIDSDQVNSRIAAATSTLSTVAFTGSYLDLTNKPATSSAPVAMSFGSTTRSLNSNYTVSSTRAALVSYSVNATWTLNALLSGTGTAFLEYSTNGGSSWNTVNQVSKTLNLLTVAGGDDMNLVGTIPAGALVRIRTTATNMTLSWVRGQEVLLPSN